MPTGQRVRRDWPAVVQDQASSGLSASAYCAAHGIHRSLFYKRRRECQSMPASPTRFIELKAVEAVPGGSGVAVVSPDGWRVEVEPDFDAATLERVCACVERRMACSR